jgi:hypothetical protein
VGGKGKERNVEKIGKKGKKKKRLVYTRGIAFSLELPPRPQIVSISTILSPHVPGCVGYSVTYKGWGVSALPFRRK